VSILRVNSRFKRIITLDHIAFGIGELSKGTEIRKTSPALTIKSLFPLKKPNAFGAPFYLN